MRIWAVAVAAFLGLAWVHATATSEPKAREALNRTSNVALVAALEPASARGTPADIVGYASAGGVSRSGSRTRMDSGAASGFEQWSLWVGGLGMIVFVVRRRLSD